MEKSKIKSGRPEAIHPGERYGMLVVIRREADDTSRHCRYLCHCDCGNDVVVLGGSLRIGKTRSCGCLRRERMRAAARAARQVSELMAGGPNESNR